MADFTVKLKPAEPAGPESLARERSQSQVPVKELARHLFSEDGFLERQERVLQELQKEKLLSKATQQHLSRPDRYKLGLARAKLLRRMADRLGWDIKDHQMAEYLVDEVSPYLLHMSMFVTTVREQASDEQKAYWLPLIEKWKIYGSYAQTELGHGSNVRGLELRATYDTTAKKFVLHSPTLTASKWWNGSLGRTATHAIVVAQLLLPSQDNSSEYISYGPHPFIVRVRDPKTHQPLQGIVVGDIGPKYGYASMDNAYMLFDNFSIPHSAFLSRYSQVDPDTGAYTTNAQSPAVVYGSLTNIRVNIVMHARLVLARAVTVACRYLTIRRQFRDRDSKDTSGPEMAVLDYPTVQIRVLPLLATTYALHYSGLAMGSQYASAREAITGGDFSALADLHATSSGLKSLCTMLAADGIEVCRRALGGHGFGGGSGLIQLNSDYLSKPTVEGDNWMITQQTASYLIKKMAAVAKHIDSSATPKDNADTDPTETSFREYLAARHRGLADTPPFDVLASDDAILAAFARRAAHLAHEAHLARNVAKTPWTALLIQLHNLSVAHSQHILVRNFHAALFPPASSSHALASSSAPASYSPETPSTAPAPGIPDAARPVLLTCFRLFALNTLHGSALAFLSSSAVSLATLDTLPARIQALMAELRPHAVRLVDSWSVPDYLLDSALGRADGRVYEELFERAHRLNPLNRETFNPYYWEQEVVWGEGKWKARL